MDSDTALANRLAKDVDSAFPTLVEAHQDRLYTIALRLLGDQRDAEEVAQDALVRAYRAIGGYPRERIVALRLRPWLASIAVNLARNRRRRFEDRQPPNQLEPMLDAGFDPATDDRWAAPAVQAERHDAQRELAFALLRLTPQVRAAIVLRHVDGLSVAEVAEALDRPEGTIKAQVHRGLRELRALLEAGPDVASAAAEPADSHRSIARAASPLPAMEAIR